MPQKREYLMERMITCRPSGDACGNLLIDIIGYWVFQKPYKNRGMGEKKKRQWENIHKKSRREKYP
ncbi:hypothetical protein DXN04_06660 [Chitinophaga silvisoli]|uniref:Uncharacterized protein n=1 Tax=Chitinophaga silvisoli TaxID=2291814 RepID=A0A3E1P4M9_9BACT|nr:hypothetical protein DXN04_06660 [Chitinophaga silvisoli]